MTNERIKIICFDLGGVLLEVNWQLTLDYFNLTITPQKALLEIGQSQIYFEYEKGNIKAGEFAQYINQKYNCELSTEKFKLGWNKCLTGAINGAAEIIDSIPHHYKIFALSNTNQEHYDYYRHFSFFKKFKKIIASQHLGLRKPDPLIYQKAIELINHPPQEILYFDDLIENVEGAKKAFMNALHIKDPIKDLTAGLKKFGVI